MNTMAIMLLQFLSKSHLKLAKKDYNVDHVSTESAKWGLHADVHGFQLRRAGHFRYF